MTLLARCLMSAESWEKSLTTSGSGSPFLPTMAWCADNCLVCSIQRRIQRRIEGKQVPKVVRDSSSVALKYFQFSIFNKQILSLDPIWHPPPSAFTPYFFRINLVINGHQFISGRQKIRINSNLGQLWLNQIEPRWFGGDRSGLP